MGGERFGSKRHARYPCKYCSMAFHQPSTRDEHQRTHLRGTSYTCSDCAAVFASKSDRALYEANEHREIVKVECGGRSSDETPWGCGEWLTGHNAQQVHFGASAEKHCHAQYPARREQSLESSTQHVHCKACPRVCRGFDKFTTHLCEHLTDIDDRPFQCDCGLDFALLEMQRQHLNPYPLAAITCGPAAPLFDEKNEISHPWGCGSTFSSHSELRTHLSYGGIAGTLNACIQSLRRAEKDVGKYLEDLLEILKTGAPPAIDDFPSSEQKISEKKEPVDSPMIASKEQSAEEVPYDPEKHVYSPVALELEARKKQEEKARRALQEAYLSKLVESYRAMHKVPPPVNAIGLVKTSQELSSLAKALVPHTLGYAQLTSSLESLESTSTAFEIVLGFLQRMSERTILAQERQMLTNISDMLRMEWGAAKSRRDFGLV